MVVLLLRTMRGLMDWHPHACAAHARCYVGQSMTLLFSSWNISTVPGENSLIKMTYSINDIIFSTFHSTSPHPSLPLAKSHLGVVDSIVAMLFLLIFYEGLKTFREYLMHVAVKKLAVPCCEDSKPNPGKLNW